MIKENRVLASFVLFFIFSVIMTGTAFAVESAETALVIQSSDDTLRVTNGSSASMFITVTNTGIATISDIKPQADLPYKWLLESVTPETLILKGGESRIFTLKFSVPASQNAITQTMKLTCANAAIVSNELMIPIAVTTNPKYLWFLVVTVSLVSVFTILYFKKHGRR